MAATTTTDTDHMEEARGWVSDCFTDAPDDLTDDEVIDAIDRHFAGGWKAFQEL